MAQQADICRLIKNEIRFVKVRISDIESKYQRPNYEVSDIDRFILFSLRETETTLLSLLTKIEICEFFI